VAEPEAAEKGCIAQLQEFVQGSKQCPMPANCSILQWSYDHRMVESSLEFRAKVAFLLDGVPHHVLGTWQTSKLRAKRDVAERALCLFVSCWGRMAELEHDEKYESKDSPRHQPEEGQDGEAVEAAAAVEEVQLLARFCSSPPAPGQPALVSSEVPHRWSHTREGATCQAFVEIELLGVAHMFSGRPAASLNDACRDTACRVLWYLQCPGFEECFEPDLRPGSAKDIREPPADWMRDSVLQQDDEKEAAEKKTVLMRLQNRLQQNYARQIQAGKSAICWTYERDTADQNGHPAVRATAYIPAADRSFTSGWQKSQREAQLDASDCVSKFLDIEFPSQAGRSRSGTN
jgi:hypothetical protein